MADIKVNMGVTGVSQFKSAMTQSKTAVKALDAELKLNEAQYKASGNAEDYMKKKSELLQKQIAEQEKVVQAAEKALEQMTKNGVDPASKAFQTMKTQLVSAQTQLTSMQTALRDVGSTATASGSEVSSLSTSLKNIEKGVSFQNIHTGLSTITSLASTAFSAIKSITTGFWNLEYASSEAAQEALWNMESYGIDFATASKLSSKGIENQFGITGDKILEYVSKLQTKIKQGAKLDFDVDPNNKFLNFFNALQAMDEADYKDFFGITDQQTVTALGKLASMGFEGFTEFLGTLHGNTDEAGAEQLVEFKKAADEMTASWEEFKTTFSISFADSATKIAGAITTLVDSLTEWAKTPEGKKALENLGTSIENIITNLTNEETYKSAIETFTDLINGISDALKWFTEHDAEAILTGIGAGLAVIAGINVANGVIGLINALKGLGISGFSTGTPVVPTPGVTGGSSTGGTSTVVPTNTLTPKSGSTVVPVVASAAIVAAMYDYSKFTDDDEVQEAAVEAAVEYIAENGTKESASKYDVEGAFSANNGAYFGSTIDQWTKDRFGFSWNFKKKFGDVEQAVDEVVTDVSDFVGDVVDTVSETVADVADKVAEDPVGAVLDVVSFGTGNSDLDLIRQNYESELNELEDFGGAKSDYENLIEGLREIPEYADLLARAQGLYNQFLENAPEMMEDTFYELGSDEAFRKWAELGLLDLGDGIEENADYLQMAGAFIASKIMEGAMNGGMGGGTGTTTSTYVENASFYGVGDIGAAFDRVRQYHQGYGS